MSVRVITEGTLLLHIECICQVQNMKTFVDTDNDHRLAQARSQAQALDLSHLSLSAEPT